MNARVHVEIGVALTSFGGLFMVLGVILFFDGSLLALGNVRAGSSELDDIVAHSIQLGCRRLCRSSKWIFCLFI